MRRWLSRTVILTLKPMPGTDPANVVGSRPDRGDDLSLCFLSEELIPSGSSNSSY